MPIDKTRVKPIGNVYIKTYSVIGRAVEEGIAYGYNRAHKHTSSPDPEQLKEQIYDAVMGELSELMEFPELECDDAIEQ